MLTAGFVAGVTLRGDGGWRPSAINSPSLDRALAAQPDARALRQLYPRGEGRELVAVVLGSSKCGASRGSEIGQAIRAILDTLDQVARAHTTQFSTVGIALDERPSDGLEWLASLGGFNEVAAGARWLSMGAHRYLWSAAGSPTAIPQVIIAVRTVRVSRTGIEIFESRELARLVGARAIIDRDSLQSVLGIL